MTATIDRLDAEHVQTIRELMIRPSGATLDALAGKLALVYGKNHRAKYVQTEGGAEIWDADHRGLLPETSPEFRIERARILELERQDHESWREAVKHWLLQNHPPHTEIDGRVERYGADITVTGKALHLAPGATL